MTDTNRNLQDVLNDMDTAATDQELNALGDEFVEKAAGTGDQPADREGLTRKGTRAEARNRG